MQAVPETATLILGGLIARLIFRQGKFWIFPYQMSYLVRIKISRKNTWPQNYEAQFAKDPSLSVACI